MIPGDLVKSTKLISFYLTADDVNRNVPNEGVAKNTLGIVVSPPDGTWVKWMANGRLGWSNHNYLEKV